MTTPYPFVAGAVLTAQQLNDIQNLPISDKTTSYTLAVADAYKRTMMNSASATTITVNNSIFTVGDVIQVANKGAGICTVTAGAGVTINTSGSLALAQYGGGYLLCLSASTFTFFNLGGGANYGAATGGTGVTNVTISGVNYAYTSFTSSGTLTVTKAGLFDVYIFGGGGAAGTGTDTVSVGSSGGGGAGGSQISTVYLDANQTITIGAGGAAGLVGTSTKLGTVLTGVGGGAGYGTYPGGERVPGLSGGCGGGGGRAIPIAGIGFQGFDGNAGTVSNTNFAGGGGGAGSAGFNGSGTTGGTGGTGVQVNTFIGGSSLFKAGGGGSGASGTGGTGGSGVGGNGSTLNGSAAAANTASGGGGGYNGGTGGAGGSGIIYIRWKV